MSYRAFKRLLGETSLERKCRFLFGGFILLLITGSFWLYARQTESLAYDQIPTTSRVLANHLIERQIATICIPPAAEGIQRQSGALGAALMGGTPAGPLPVVLMLASQEPADQQRARALDEFRKRWEADRPIGFASQGPVEPVAVASRCETG